MGTFNLKDWRESRSMTRAALCRALELSRWTLKRYEDNGAPRHIELACKALENDNSAKADI